MRSFNPLWLTMLILWGCRAPSVENDPDTGANAGVILMRYAPGSESTEQREAGFLETMQQEYAQVQVLSSNQYGGTTPESALERSQQLLLKFGPRIQGVFAVCEPNAEGMLRALKEHGLAGRVAYVGFDANERMVQALADGQMAGIVLQDPVKMGYLAVKTMVAHLNGEPVEQRIATGEYVATRDNMESDVISQLLHPVQFSGPAFQPEEKKYTIAVIPKGTTHEFWKSVHAGAEQAARELGDVEVAWKGPLHEHDRELQINVVQDFITRKVDGICLAPLDSQALVSVVAEAKDLGIPTVIFDSNLADEGRYKVSYVATDNYRGGALAARCMAEAVLAAENPPTAR